MSNIQISIIVPCFNEQCFIEEMVDSVTNQTFDKNQFELIIIDGGSDDGTQQILWKLKHQYSFLKILHNPHRTAPYALNIGIKHSKGKYIARMDVHAVYPKNYLKVLYDAAKDTGAANVGCRMETLPRNHSSKTKAIAYALSHPFGVGNSHFRIGVKHTKQVDTVPFGFFHRDVFTTIGLFDTDMSRAEDYELNARITKAGMSILLISGEPIHYYARDNYQNLSQMMYQYGFFKPIANKKLGSPATLRQFVPLMLVLSLTLTGFFSLINPITFYPFMLILSIYLSGCGIAALHLVKKNNTRFELSLWLHIMFSFIATHFSYGIGYIRGILHLLTRQDISKHSTTISR